MKQKYRMSKLLSVLCVLWFGAIATTYAQGGLVTGQVTDAADGMPLPGVTVMIKGTTTGTISDFDGNYSLSVNANSVLVFSFIGYNSQEITVNPGTTVNLSLEVEETSLDEVIVVGYGVQKKSDKTGAVANVTADELNGGVITDAIQAMQGKTAGVTITKQGGDPNGGFSVKIRGSSGFSSGTDPLYVVDGVPGVDPTTIAPEDIESFNVLKDASSTAIYGARGANGVILITTKKGSAKQGTTVDFNSYMSIDQVAKRLNLLSADQMRQYVADNGIDFVDGGASTDWQDEIYRRGISQSHNLAVSGGNADANYRASITHTNFLGVIKGSEKQRTIGRLNIMQKAIDGRLTFQAGISGTIENNQYVQYSGNGSMDVLYQAFQRNPTDPALNEDGTFNELQRDFNYNNPLALIDQIQNQRAAKRFLGNTRLDFEIVDGLVAGINLGYTRDDNESFYFEPSYVLNGTSTGFGRRSYGNYESKVLETTLSYNKSVNDIHNLNFVAGYSYQEDIADGFGAQGKSPLSDYVTSHNLAVLNNVNVGDISSYKNSFRLASFFGRAVYNFNSKYYVTGTLRRDGSSKFGNNNKWCMFPSASLAWNAKEEAFLKDVDMLSMLKLRVGYGLSGNQEIGSYLSIESVSPQGTAIDPETGEDAIAFAGSHNPNPDLKWEENAEINIGLDFGLFNNKLSGSVELYKKTTYDLLAPYSVPVPPNKYPTTFANAGQIDNKGLEVNIQSFVVDKKNFSWKTTFAFTKNIQDVVSLSNDLYELDEMQVGWVSGRGMVGVWTQQIKPGQPLGTFYGWEYAGLSPDGKFLYNTAEGGVTRTQLDKDRKVLGQALPKFEIGWSNFVTVYKNIDMGFALRAVVGHDVLNVTRMLMENPKWLPTLNVLEGALDEAEKGLTSSPAFSDYYLEDGSFLRLDNVTLGYTFNTANVSWLKKFRVYATSNNLLTFTNYTGLDPEVNFSGLSFGLDQYNVYPKTKTFTFGANLTF